MLVGLLSDFVCAWFFGFMFGATVLEPTVLVELESTDVEEKSMGPMLVLENLRHLKPRY